MSKPDILAAWTPQQLMELSRTWQPYAWAVRGILIVAVLTLVFQVVGQNIGGALVQAFMVLAAWHIWQAANLFRNTAENGRWADFAEALDALTGYFKLVTIVGGITLLLGLLIMALAVAAIVLGLVALPMVAPGSGA